MRRVLYALSLGALLASGAAEAQFHGQVAEGTVELVGRPMRQAGAERYQLTASFSVPTSIAADAILAFAEPSHKLLLAHVNAEGASRGTLLKQMNDAGAFVVTTGSGASFTHTFTLPYHLGWWAERVSVILRSQEKDVELANVAVGIASLHTISRVVLESTPSGPVPLGFHHCCSNRTCGQLCIDCNGAAFSCDLINCTIECVSFSPPT